MIFYGLHKSDKPDKKYFVELGTESGRRKRVYFGAAGMNDYTKFSALERDERKRRYMERHQANEDWGQSGMDTAGFWSRWILWNKPTVKDSLADTLRRFPFTRNHNSP